MKKTLFLSVIICSLLMPAGSPLAEPPKRIISLAPNITEILFALGLDEQIVGVTSFCDFPPEAKTKPKVGGMSNPSLEAIVSLRPDLVVMTTDGNPKAVEERLKSLTIKTYVFRARRLSELPQGLRDLGFTLGVKEGAEILAGKIESSLGSFPRNTPHSSRKAKILFIIWPEPLIVAGPGTAIDDAINLLGYRNIGHASQTSYPKYSIEEVIRQAPDIIFIGKGHAEIKEMSEGLLQKISAVPAVKNHKVFFVSDSLYRLGPRAINGIQEISACLR